MITASSALQAFAQFLADSGHVWVTCGRWVARATSATCGPRPCGSSPSA